MLEFFLVFVQKKIRRKKQDMETNKVENEAEGEVVINLLDLFFYIWSRAWFVILITIMCSAFAYVYSSYFMTKYYESSTTIWVMGSNSDSSSTTITYSDIQINTQMANDYINIITSRYVLNEIIEQLELDKTVDSLNKLISTEIIEDSRMITITVKYDDPEMAQEIADRVAEVSSERILDVIQLNSLAVTTVDEANLPTSPSSPNVKRYTYIGAFGGFFLSLVILIIMFIMDDTIKTDEDIMRYLGYTTLASIPEMESEDSKDSKKSGRRKKSDDRRSSHSESAESD